MKETTPVQPQKSVPVKPEKKGKMAWWKNKILPLAGLIIAVAIIVVIGYFYFKYPDFFKQENVEKLGYTGVFVISVILNATVIIPVSNMTIIFAMGAALSMPWAVGMLGGIAAAIGEMTGYIAGRSGRGLLAKNRAYVRVEGWVKRWGWIAIFLLSIVPFAFDVVGIIAGALRMPYWKFTLATWAGRTIIYVTVAYLGHWGINSWFG
jgi:membrane protein DedA with SNARE-associated domain